MGFELGPRRGVFIDISREKQEKPLAAEELKHFEQLDLMYRSLCAMPYNYVPMSGHPGGSISSGRFVAGVLFDSLDYDVADPDREDADIVSYAAGHKTLGLYALWALRNEVTRIGCPELLPKGEKHQLRLEDLLGFRRNPLTRTPLFRKFRVKPLDGHPTPATPFLRLSTGASGVGVAASLGLAYGAMDFYGAGGPRVHIVEGEGGMTPERVGEAMAAAGTACLKNAIPIILGTTALRGGSYGAAAAMGKPAVLTEAGGQGILDEPSTQTHVRGVLNVLKRFGGLSGTPEATPPPVHYNKFVWVAAEQDCVYYPKVTVGQQVREGDLVAEFTDLFGDKIGDLRSPATGPVLFLVTSPAINKNDPLMAIGA